MAVYAIGPVESSVLTVQAVEDVPSMRYLASELTTGNESWVVPDDVLTAVGGKYGLFGRKLNAGPPITLADRTLAERRPEWTSRVKRIYIDGMGMVQQWWPTRYAVIDDAKMQRSKDVIEIELPMWHSTNCAILMAAIMGRSWMGMTAEQIEDAIVWMESLLGGGVAAIQPNLIEAWYVIGRDRETSSYNLLNTISTGYTDTFRVNNNGVLVQRTPDYSWLPVPFSLPEGGVSAWNPEEPT